MRELVFVMAGMAMSLAVLAAADAQPLGQAVNWPAGGFLQADQTVITTSKPKDLNVKADEGFCWLSGVMVTKGTPATATAKVYVDGGQWMAEVGAYLQASVSCLSKA